MSLGKSDRHYPYCKVKQEIKQSSVNTTSTEIENFNDTPEQIDLQTKDASASDISVITPNSDISENVSDNASNPN
ncbi:32205_t:CDS:2, partial [Gigaspora margarita]